MTLLNRHDAIQQYQGCLVEVNSTLGFVREIVGGDGEGDVKLAIKFLGERGNKLIDPDPDVVLCPTTPYRLGYIQTSDGNAIYLSRSPRRQYQIGWSENNVSGFRMNDLLRVGAGLRDQLLNVFPSFKDCVKLSEERGGTYVFDRMFSVTDRGRLLAYKGNPVARIVDGVPNLAEQNNLEKKIGNLLTQAMEK